jgi:hypothetical protein
MTNILTTLTRSATVTGTSFSHLIKKILGGTRISSRSKYSVGLGVMELRRAHKRTRGDFARPTDTGGQILLTIPVSSLIRTGNSATAYAYISKVLLCTALEQNTKNNT